MTRAFFIVLLLLCVGCASSRIGRELSAINLVGEYSNRDWFSPRTLELNSDGSFTYTQWTEKWEELPDGSFRMVGSWSHSGDWKFLLPDKIELTLADKSAQIAVFVRQSRKHGFVIIEPDLHPNILSSWSPNDPLIGLRRKSSTKRE